MEVTDVSEQDLDAESIEFIAAAALVELRYHRRIEADGWQGYTVRFA